MRFDGKNAIFQSLSDPKWISMNSIWQNKFFDAGIQEVSTSISIVHDLIKISPDDVDESDKHI